MATAEHSDAEVHEYFSPYDSPHEAYLIFMHVLSDLRAHIRAALPADRAARTLVPDVPPKGTTK